MSDQHFASKDKFDVVILGSGIGGTLLGAILARNGVKVLILEQSTHPRFAIGESTVPETTQMFGILAKRYGVPEIEKLSNYQNVRTSVSSACGIKRNFSFIYHRQGEAQRPQEATQFPTWAPPFGPDIHFYRQDVDAYMLAVAIRYGAVVQQNIGVTEIEIDEKEVYIKTNRDDEYRASYVVDAGGFNSPIAKKFGLRETPCPMKTQSRSIFTHMVNVTPYDQCGADRSEHGLPSPFHQGTLHHVFDGGWMWVIPFNNHPTSTNSLCSVGISLDLAAYPKTNLTPEQEFKNIINRFPGIAKQFENAQSVREWIATERNQYSSKQAVGERFCLLPHAAGFVDPLFSSGLGITLSTINQLSDRLIKATANNDFSTQHFASLETWLFKNLNHFDRLVSCSYIAFSNFNLWNAWHRIWMLGSFYGLSSQVEILYRYEATKDPNAFGCYEMAPYRGLQALDFPEYAQLFNECATYVESVRAGTLLPDEAAEHIYKSLKNSELCPKPWQLAKSTQRFPGTLTLFPMLRLLTWGKFQSPAVVRKNFFVSGNLLHFSAIFWRVETDEFLRSINTILRMIRDTFFSWNQDYKKIIGKSH
jgi:tetracycline 7-halogenase / FADH2 O2-dependent halogenase